MAKSKEDKFKTFLNNRKIPLLTLDNKWHTLFPDEIKTSAIKRAEKELNTLIQKQGQLSNDIKDYKKLKASLMHEIVDNMEAATSNNNELQKKQQKNQKYILEINQKIENHTKQLSTIPDEIDKANEHLMMLCMELLYTNLKNNDNRITELTDYIKDARARLTRSMIEREELQEYNATMYGYMHDLFGPEITNIFDIRYKAFQPDREEQKGAFINGISSKKQ